jgi:hypothetical protein
MRIENIRVFGFEPALEGMRNPMDSWGDSDSAFYEKGTTEFWQSQFGLMRAPEKPTIGMRDMALATKLIKRGSEHRKFLRQIMIWVRVTLPRYVWQELDTYKVATTRNSCSTMNKLGHMDLDQYDFEDPVPDAVLNNINALAKVLREAKQTKEDVRGARVQLKNDLPEGYLQRAMYSMSYETALSMLLQRERHRLPQWRLTDERSICQFLMGLPYMGTFYSAATAKKDALKEAKRKLRRLASMADDLQVESSDLNEVLNLLDNAT